jgi:hypothetical protein
MLFGESFLVDRDSRTWTAPAGVPKSLTPNNFFLGHGDHALEVALATSEGQPKADDVRSLWRARQGRRPSPLLLVVRHGGESVDRVSVCGPVGESPPLLPDLEMSQVERLCAAALDEPSRHAAVRFLLAMLPEVGSDLPGLRNSGLLATQELRYGVPSRGDWLAAGTKGRELLSLRGRPLIERLGFGVAQLSTASSVLTIDGAKRAVAIFLDEGEVFEDRVERFGTSPVSHALALADREGLPWVVMTRARQIRLYAARAGTGVGRKGRAETFVEVDLALLPTDLAGYLPLLFGAGALSEDGTIEQILKSSTDFAAELGSRLRNRVYYRTVPTLATAVARHLHAGTASTDDELAAVYEETLIALFRLLFVAYAEDKDLLPYRTNSRYNDHSLKRLARRLAEWHQKGIAFDDRATDLWDDVRSLWEAVDQGNSGWGVPAYNGGLFSSLATVSVAGAALARVTLTDAEFGPALTALLVDTGAEGVVGPVDFRSLSVREFGTLYEGLLESMLSHAQSDLAVDKRGNYVPVEGNAAVVVPAGEVYFHNRSGSRKATGSYFTKPFVVEHLLDHALEPALDVHIARLAELLASGDEAATADAFFDFRCVDLAMGSGHFLVAAVDRIEARLSSFLALNPVPRVSADLEELRTTAVAALGELADGAEIETMSLLRRQVARRCIYGIDLTGIAVELSRLAIWIHTFVPGLPLSFLDHNLVQGNSLTGIGTLEEAVAVLEPDLVATGQLSVFLGPMMGFLGRAEKALKRLAITSDATRQDVDTARAAHLEAIAAVAPARDLLDILVAARLSKVARPVQVDEREIAAYSGLERARALARQLEALHFPVAFPEVFLRTRAGFDCVIGNPPWDKVLFEAQAFWVARAPGLNALPEGKRAPAIAKLRAQRPEDAQLEDAEKNNRELLQAVVEAAYPNRGRGHYDFAKLFVERAVSLLNEDATLGYVLPASSLLLGGWGKLRELLFDTSDLTVAQVRNRGGWLFEDVEHRTAVALVTRHPRGGAESTATIWPGITSIAALRAVDSEDALHISRTVLETLSDSVVIPWLNDISEKTVFESVRLHPSLSAGLGWVSAGHDARWDFRSSGAQHRFAAAHETESSWRVLMTRHVIAFALDETPSFQQYIPKPELLGNGVITVMESAALGPDHPLVIFRHPSRNDDSRTMVATALPEKGFLHNKGYVHALRHAPGTSLEQLMALLGFLNTFTCDWWVRRFVDRHLTAPVVNNVRLPDWTPTNISSAAEIAGTLLMRGDVRTLAGGRLLLDKSGTRSTIELRADLERLAAEGFALGRNDMRVILDDFSDREASCPAALRSAILDVIPR